MATGPHPALDRAAAQRWVFGYGSLIWKADFRFHERRRAALQGWMRRFWQGSHDHRGTPDAPGRVVTLVTAGDEAAASACIGVAYRVDEDVFPHLDYREKNGYERVDVDIRLLPTGAVVRGVTYVAEPGNRAFLGPATLDEMAAQIRCARGPSGSNAHYLLALQEALAQLDTVDEHVDALVRRISCARGVGAAHAPIVN